MPADEPFLIGVRDLSMRGWMAGGIVTRTMVLSLQSAGARVVYAANSPEAVPTGVSGLVIRESHYLPLEWSVRRWCRIGPKDTISQHLKAAGVQVVLPTIGSMRIDGIPSVGWIPDFQHLHLPALFSAEKKATFDREFDALATRSRRVLLSSEDARGDFVRHFPRHAEKGRVASFPSLFAFEPPIGTAGAVLTKYHLPKKFLLVINQFWRHKNHRAVVEALGILKKAGMQIPLVMAGLPVDYRDPDNSALTETFQAMALGDVAGQCVFLGKIDRQDIVDLLRTASAVVQPSRFEGWNTTVQDAKALGCPVFASDLAVHREQCPDALGFFSPDDPDQLADLLANKWSGLPARPDPALEKTALAREKDFAHAYGTQLLSICSECLPS